MKNKISLCILIVSLFSALSVNGQITISPEIGVSYLPFKLYPVSPWGSSYNINSKKINLLLGVSARMLIYEKWTTKLRISYADRNDVAWTEYGDFGPGADYEWKHQDLNIDLNGRYNLYENLSVGLGPSLIRSFMELNKTSHEDGEVLQMKANKFFFGLNAAISLEIKRVNINLVYLRINKFEANRVPVGNNRIDLTVGYRIGKGR